MPGVSKTDDALARAARDGCRDSFEELARRLRARLVFVLTRKLGSVHDAEDVTQQTLMRVHERLGDYDPGRAIGPWVMTIALRLSTDLQRAAGRRRDHTQRFAEQPPGSTAGNAGGFRSGEGDPGTAVVAAEQREALWAAAQRVLSAEQWTALWLHYGEGMTPREVAAALRRRHGSVRVMLHRARKTLGEALAVQSSEMADTSGAVGTSGNTGAREAVTLRPAAAVTAGARS